jgi:predicted RNA methylase
MAQLQPELSELFAEHFRAGNGFSSITEARRYVGYLAEPGTSAAKLIEESIEAGVVRAARDLVQKEPDPLSAYEQCLDLYNRMPALNTRTSTSVLQQAYSTPVPIAFLAAKLADIHRDATVYEPSAGNGSLLLLANPKNSIVNELNPDRAAELRAQGFNVTQEDASTFVPQVLPVDRVITNPPFGSVKEALGQNRLFRQGLLITSQIDQAIALKALDLMKPDGKAVLILGGKMGDEDSRKERYNTQLSRGFYRWLYKDAGYKVTDHFSIAGSLYRKQGAGFPIDLLLIEGKGETTLKLPAVEVPRVYSSFDELKEVLVHATQQQIEPETDSGITLQRVYSGQALDTRSLPQPRRDTPYTLDDGVSSRSTDRDRDSPRVPVSTDATSGSVNRPSDRGLAHDLRTPRGTGSRKLGSQRDFGVSTALHEQSQPPSNSSTDGRVSGDELPRTTDGVLPGLGTTVPHSSISLTTDEPELSRRHESDRLADLYEYGREPTQLSGLKAMADQLDAVALNSEETQKKALSNQVPYQPRSQAPSLETLVPAASIKGLEKAFNKIEATTGLSLDEYVRSRLNEPSLLELFKHYAAEQIDSIALSIYNHEYEQKATLIGHDTGIGKTRIICGLARYAQQQNLTPIIVTADPVLYSDILARDAVDTGNSFNPLVTNNEYKLSLKSPDGKDIGEIHTGSNHAEKIRAYTRAGNIGEHDSVFTTYGQLTGSASVDRRQLLEAIATSAFLILDESHKAGGAAGEQRPKTNAQEAREKAGEKVSSCTEFFQQLVTQTPGFIASSATAIKDPIVAARLFYNTTDLKLAAPDQETFTEHLKSGGVPLQQQVFAMWAESGGCIRCEKSYEGIEFGVEKIPVSLKTAENNAQILNLIWQFDKLKEEAVESIHSDLAEAGEAAKEKNPALGDAGATSTIFTSVLHNLTAVTSLALKAEETANRVIQDIEQGRKPIIMLFNTMESTIKNFIDTHNELALAHNAEFPDSPINRISPGDAVSINASELFFRYLEKSRTIKITEPYLDELTGKQKTRSHRLSDEELGAAGVAAYNRAERAIATTDWSKLPISPIDYIKQKIEDAGHSIGEITGRTHILKYESAQDLKAGVVTYSTRKHGAAQKKQVMDDFQNGQLDAIITNSTTGYSLHASRQVADQRQRVMYIVQPHLDVNQVEQSIGRSHRTGQVNPAIHAPDATDEQGRSQWGQFPGTFGLPVFKLVVGQDLPTEERAVAVLMKKMSHLKANTTGNRSSSFGLVDMPDFINKYGNEVAQKLMEENPDLHGDLDYPLANSEQNDKAIQKVTGRAVMLTSNEPPTAENPYPSLARQAWLYDMLTSEYREYLAQKIALGENELEAQKLDLQAEPVERLVLNPGEPNIDSPFTKPAYLVEVMAKSGAKPNTTLQVANAVRKELGFEVITDLTDHDDYERSDVRQKGREIAQETIDELHQVATNFLDAHTQAKIAEINVLEARVAKYQEKFEAQLAIQAELLQPLNSLTSDEQAEGTRSQLLAQLEQQNPKIEKLQQQLSKAKLALNGKQYELKKDQRIAKNTLAEVTEQLQRFPVGQGVKLTDRTSQNSLYGVVAAVEQKNSSNNPAAPNNWKLKLLVVDGVRSLSIKLDSLVGKGAKHSLEPLETAPSFLNPKQDSSIYELFDECQTESKEKRYLVSGQVLCSQLTGKFAQVTDHQGQVHPVYLLRRGFDPQKDLDKKPVRLETSGQIRQFLFEATGLEGVVQTEDGNLTIQASLKRGYEGGLILTTPKATTKGGAYFKDGGLVELTGDFVSSTQSTIEGGVRKSQSVMTVCVPPERTPEVLSYISGKWNVGAASHKNVAKEMLGQSISTWEPCNEINPDVERVIVGRTLSIERQETPYAPEPALSIQRVAAACQQSGGAEKNVAKLLEQAGLSDAVMQGEDFHLKVENEPYIPLVVERHGNRLYLTHYLEQNGDTFIDSEMVFGVKDSGQLAFRETAVQNPFTGGESRAPDRGFAQTFSRNLLHQGFAEAAALAYAGQLSQPNPVVHKRLMQQPPHAQLPEELVPQQANPQSIQPHREQKPELSQEPIEPRQLTLDLFGPIAQSQTVAPLKPKTSSPRHPRTSSEHLVVEQLTLLTPDLKPKVVAQPQKELAPATSTAPTSQLQASKPSTDLATLRWWYRSAFVLERSPDYIKHITKVIQEFKQGQLPCEKAMLAMHGDITKAMEQWLKASEKLDKSVKYQQRIQEIMHDFKEGKPLSTKPLDFMEQDIQQQRQKVRQR